MCGIAGSWDTRRQTQADELFRQTQAQLETILHRGPDDEGIWLDPQAGIALGMRRLAIVDLTEAGHQPMTSSDQRYVIVFNGEIYNAESLRSRLPKQAYRGHSDTEVLLAAIQAWGPHKALTEADGMFGLALWDRRERALFLARDKMGQKPVFWGFQGSTFLFASELKALRVHPAFSAPIDPSVLPLYLRHNLIPAPYSIYKGIAKLLPGMLLRLGEGQQTPTISAFWSLRQTAEDGIRHPFLGSEDDAVLALDHTLKQAVNDCMISDVPLGAFLSGGIDSSTIVALMQSQTSRPIKTFSIGFSIPDYNEAEHAAAVAKALGTEHTELYIQEADALAVIPLLPAMYDEPFSDSSQIPTFLVSQMARRHVTVALSGDGGDELFGGYNRHIWLHSIGQALRFLPPSLRSSLAGLLRLPPPAFWSSLSSLSSASFLPFLRLPQFADKVQKFASLLTASSPQEGYLRMTSLWQDPSLLLGSSVEPPSLITKPEAWPDLSSLPPEEASVLWLLFQDAMTYLPDDGMTKMDRASMAVSLEARVPFLDTRVVALSWRFPLSLKLRHGQGKWILRRLLSRYLPASLQQRPKQGFAIPLHLWLRTHLREWAEALLNEDRLRRDGFFDPKPIRKAWKEHLEGQRLWQYPLWAILQFQAWLDSLRLPTDERTR